MVHSCYPFRTPLSLDSRRIFIQLILQLRACSMVVVLHNQCVTGSLEGNIVPAVPRKERYQHPLLSDLLWQLLLQNPLHKTDCNILKAVLALPFILHIVEIQLLDITLGHSFHLLEVAAEHHINCIIKCILVALSIVVVVFIIHTSLNKNNRFFDKNRQTCRTVYLRPQSAFFVLFSFIQENTLIFRSCCQYNAFRLDIQDLFHHYS